MSASSGNETVTSRSFRLWARTRPPSTNSRAPDSVPLDFEGPVLAVRRQLSGDGQHRLDGLGKRVGAGGRAVPVDHPVAVIRLEQHEASGGLRPVECELHLRVGPLLHVVGSGVPDSHAATPVLTLGDLALECRILKGMILRVHGEVVLFRGLREALGQSPGDEHTVPLQSEVPVQTAGVVFLDHKSLPGRLFRRTRTHRLGCLVGVSFGAVGVELARPACRTLTRRPRRHQHHRTHCPGWAVQHRV